MSNLYFALESSDVFIPTSRVERVTFSRSRKGPRAAAAFLPLSLRDAYRVYNQPGTMFFDLTNRYGRVVWRGRVEDQRIVPGGLELQAFGLQRMMSDILYTALWSVSSVADWRPVTSEDAANRKPDLYQMDNNNRLFITLVKGAEYAHITDIGELTFASPHRGNRAIWGFSADYEITLPAGLQMRILQCNDSFGSSSVMQTINGTGATQTGVINLTSMTMPRLLVQVRNNSGSSYVVTDETGELYIKLTSLRIVSAAAVTSSAIANAVATYVQGINTGMIARKVIPSSTDLLDELYEDRVVADLLDDLSDREGYTWSVDDWGVFRYQPQSSGRQWWVDAGSVQLERSLDAVGNEIYATYNDPNRRVMRTVANIDAGSVQRTGWRRQAMVSVNSTSAVQAEHHRDIRLQDASQYQVRATIEFRRIIDSSGAVWPLWAVMPGDMITVRNLPPHLVTDDDVLSSFVVAETEYDAVNDQLRVEPTVPIPTLVTLIAAAKG